MPQTATPTTPVTYHPGIEQDEPDEAVTADELVATLRSISETTFKDGGHALRSVHAKSHALLLGELEVMGGLPPVLAQGLFATAARYPAVMRISTISGDLLDDNISLPRGLGLKIIGVSGERLDGSEDDTTQDFVMVNSPAFGAPSGKKFLKSLKLVAKTTDKAEGLKTILSSALQGLERIVEGSGGKSGTLIALGGHPETNPLGETYYTQLPVLYGAYIAKLSIAPVSPELMALKDAPVELSDHPNGLRDAALAFFEKRMAVWELRVQLCTDIETMPVEDSSVPWSEDQSPYVAVARLTVQPQPAWSEQRSRRIDDGLAFNPWHGLAAHRPLGSIMRLRKPTYKMSSQFRSKHNRCPLAEPKGRENVQV